MGVLRIGNTKSKNLADDISEKVPKSVQLQALIDTYPNGIMRGTQFEIGSLDRKSTRLNSSHGYISYAVFCLKKKK